MNSGKLAFVPMDQIDLGDRRREDYGSIDELMASIKERGLIHPIAIQSDDGNPPYKLCAGGRRFLACSLLHKDPSFETSGTIACRIYDHPLSPLELKAIELFENLDRKDLNFKEECELKRDMHNLMVEIHGEKVSTSPNASGWSMRDTANMLGKSIGGVSDDIKLANTMSSMPELQLDQCKNKSEAMKMVSRLEETVLRAELVKRAEKELGEVNKKLADFYILGDFFEKVKEIPTSSIDLVEIDPPYAIDLQKQKKLKLGYDAVHGDSYNEVEADTYHIFMKNVLQEAYRVMNDHSWLILWFAPEPWFEPMYHILTEVGFKTRRIPGIWKKGTAIGQSKHPEIYLGASYEMFFYARKGSPTISKPGRSGVFDYSTVPPTKKVHPTERPVGLMEDILSTFTWEGSRILVPFAGSGNTLVAASNCKMLPIGFDLSKEYRDAYVARVIARRVGE